MQIYDKCCKHIAKLWGKKRIKTLNQRHKAEHASYMLHRLDCNKKQPTAHAHSKSLIMSHKECSNQVIMIRTCGVPGLMGNRSAPFGGSDDTKQYKIYTQIIRRQESYRQKENKVYLKANIVIYSTFTCTAFSTHL